MLEKQVNEEIAVAYLKTTLASDERKPGAQLQQEVPQMLQESAFQFALVNIFPEHEKVKSIRILGDLLREVRLRRWQGFVEVGDGFARALM